MEQYCYYYFCIDQISLTQASANSEPKYFQNVENKTLMICDTD